jgi:beta-glucanase (GH16 family)
MTMSSPDRRPPQGPEPKRRDVLAAAGIALGGLLGAGALATPVFSVPPPPAPGAFFDDFAGPAGSPPDPAIWSFETGAGGWGNNELQTYTATNATLDGNSHLVLSADIDLTRPGGSQYTSARLTTRGTVTPTFGTVEARIKLPDGHGLLPAFWMLGTNSDDVGYPACGEIDIVETPSSTGYSSHLVHGPGPADNTANLQAGGGITHPTPLSADFHTYATVRSPGRIAISIDGTDVAVISEADTAGTIRWVFDQPFYLLLNVAIGGNWPGAPTATTPAHSEMVVDWVRVTPAA